MLGKCGKQESNQCTMARLCCLMLVNKMRTRRRGRIHPAICFMFLLTVVLCCSSLVTIYKYNIIVFKANYYEEITSFDENYHQGQRRSATLADSNFTYQLDLRRFEEEFPHLQSYTCALLIGRPSFCQTPNGTRLFMLAIKSHPKSFIRTATLRQTWAREHTVLDYLVKTMFLVAVSPNEAEMNLTFDEAAVFRDILLWDFTESHHNLSLKERCFLEWIYQDCPEVEFIFKGDDDGYVNPEALVAYLKETDNVSKAIHGNMQVHPPPDRYGKYGVSRTVYPMDTYPPFLSGGGFLIPSEFVPALYQATIWLPVFPLDDVYFAFLVLAANGTYRHDDRFCVYGIKDDKCNGGTALVIHGILPRNLMDIWRNGSKEAHA